MALALAWSYPNPSASGTRGKGVPEGEDEGEGAEMEEGEVEFIYVVVLLDWAGTVVAACTIFKLFSSYSILPPPLLRIEASSGLPLRMIGPGQLSTYFLPSWHALRCATSPLWRTTGHGDDLLQESTPGEDVRSTSSRSRPGPEGLARPGGLDAI